MRGLEPVIFESFSSTDLEYYHTNVLLSLGEKFAVFCAESIKDDKERERVVSLLKEDREVIFIT